jgi:hypothetical protein
MNGKRQLLLTWVASFGWGMVSAAIGLSLKFNWGLMLAMCAGGSLMITSFIEVLGGER